MPPGTIIRDRDGQVEIKGQRREDAKEKKNDDGHVLGPFTARVERAFDEMIARTASSPAAFSA